MFINILLPLIIAIVVIGLVEQFVDDSSTRQLIYMTIIGAGVLKYMLISKTLFTLIFTGTYLIFYMVRYMFRLS